MRLTFPRVLIIDSFDSEMEEEFASEIMDNRMSFLAELSAIQGSNGVATINVAGSVRVVESPLKGRRTTQLRDLQTVLADEITQSGYVDASTYDRTNVDFAEARQYVIAFKNQEVSRNWNRNQAQVEYELWKRFASTTSVKPFFHYFDSAIMASYAKYSVDPEQTFESVIERARSLAYAAVEQSSRSRTVRGNVMNEPNSSFSGMDATESCSKENVCLSQEGLASSSPPAWKVPVQKS